MQSEGSDETSKPPLPHTLEPLLNLSLLSLPLSGPCRGSPSFHP